MSLVRFPIFRWCFCFILLPLLTSQKDGTGKLGLLEFKILWIKIEMYLVCFHYYVISTVHATWNRWLYTSVWKLYSMPVFIAFQDIFCKNDMDKSGTMSSMELREAVEKSGQILPPKIQLGPVFAVMLLSTVCYSCGPQKSIFEASFPCISRLLSKQCSTPDTGCSLQRTQSNHWLWQLCELYIASGIHVQ